MAGHESNSRWDEVRYLYKEIEGLEHKIDASQQEILQAIRAKEPHRYIANLEQRKSELVAKQNVLLDHVAGARDARPGEVPCCCPALQVQ